jgi:predicted dehydrogenase
MNPKVLIIGLGSMGKRRIRNLHSLKVSNIYGYDVNQKEITKARKEYKIKILDSLSEIATFKFDVVLICTPPQHHLPYVKICTKNKLPFFTELNLITTDVKKIVQLEKKSGIAGFPSNTTLFNKETVLLKKIIGQKSKGYFVYHLGQNINDWHPWQKSGQYFIFSPATNGLREILRVELPWLIKIFGPVANAKSIKNSFFTKKYKIDDQICVNLNFSNGNTGILIFDLIAPSVVKEFKMISDKNIITWEEIDHLIKIETAGKVKRIDLSPGSVFQGYKFKEDDCIEEMEHLLNCLERKISPEYRFKDELKLLEMIDKIN